MKKMESTTGTARGWLPILEQRSLQVSLFADSSVSAFSTSSRRQIWSGCGCLRFFGKKCKIFGKQSPQESDFVQHMAWLWERGPTDAGYRWKIGASVILVLILYSVLCILNRWKNRASVFLVLYSVLSIMYSV